METVTAHKDYFQGELARVKDVNWDLEGTFLEHKEGLKNSNQLVSSLQSTLDLKNNECATLRGRLTTAETEITLLKEKKVSPKPELWKGGKISYGYDVSLPSHLVQETEAIMQGIFTSYPFLTFVRIDNVQILEHCGGTLFRLSSDPARSSTSELGYPGHGNLSYVNLEAFTTRERLRNVVEHEVTCHVVLGMPHLHQCDKARELLEIDEAVQHDIDFARHELIPYWDEIVEELGFVPCNSICMYGSRPSGVQHYEECVWKGGEGYIQAEDRWIMSYVYGNELAHNMRRVYDKAGKNCQRLHAHGAARRKVPTKASSEMELGASL